MAARILVIEDHPANLDLMRYLLEAFRYEVIAARDGTEGLAVAAAERPDLILCDVQLPDIDGFDALRRIRSDSGSAAVRVVAVTALAMVGDRDKALAAGFDGYLSKPIDPESFVRDVESFLPPSLHSGHTRSAAPTLGSAAEPRRAGRTILVVDNQPVNLDFVATLFGGHGYRVVTTLDAAEAPAIARRVRSDLILSDVCMPQGTGYDLIKAVKADAELKHIPFVFITSTVPDEESRRKGLALGAAKFLFRPIEPQELLAQVRECLGETRD